MGGQGQSEFHYAEELEEFAGTIAEITECDSDFLASGQTQQADRRVAKRGQILRPVALLHLAFVFAQGDVSHPVQTVFDAPVPTPMANQKGRVGPGARKAGDGVLNLDRAATFAAGCALKSANLRRAGPIEISQASRVLACKCR